MLEIQQAASLKLNHFVINNTIKSYITILVHISSEGQPRSLSSEGQSTTD